MASLTIDIHSKSRSHISRKLTPYIGQRRMKIELKDRLRSTVLFHGDP